MHEDMRNQVAIMILLMLGITAVAAQRNIEGLKEEADHAQGGHQAKLASELAEYLVGSADQQFTAGDNQQAQATIQDVLKYAQMARDAAVKSRDNLKQTEIKLRQTQRRLEALKRTLSVDDRPPLDTVEKKIDQFRQDLLDAMFSPKKKSWIQYHSLKDFDAFEAQQRSQSPCHPGGPRSADRRIYAGNKCAAGA